MNAIGAILSRPFAQQTIMTSPRCEILRAFEGGASVNMVALTGFETATPRFLARLQSAGMLHLGLGGLSMAYEWDERRARQVRLIKMASMWALTTSAFSIPVALL